MELVFVIVVIGILASVAMPRLWVTRDDAIITKGRSDVATIRSAIATLKQKNLLEQASTLLPATLDTAASNTENEQLFTNLLDYPIYSKDADGHWMKTGNTEYSYKVMNNSVVFDYNPATGRFDCDHTNEYCRKLTH
ncbi:type II secretion envelope pseudopilin protein [Hydrogenimonas sp.]|nr:type II secretion envelope pseudopilin protein [Hydrogenimonas sp.]